MVWKGGGGHCDIYVNCAGWEDGMQGWFKLLLLMVDIGSMDVVVVVGYWSGKNLSQSCRVPPYLHPSIARSHVTESLHHHGAFAKPMSSLRHDRHD